MILPRRLHRDKDVLQLQALLGRATGRPEAALPRGLRGAAEAPAPAACPGPRAAAAPLPARARPSAGHVAARGLRRAGARPLRRGPAGTGGGGRRAAAGRRGGLSPGQQQEEDGGSGDGEQDAGPAEPQPGAAHAAAPPAPAALRGGLMAPRPGGSPG